MLERWVGAVTARPHRADVDPEGIFVCVVPPDERAEDDQGDEAGEVRLGAAQPGEAGRRGKHQEKEDARQEQQAVQLGLRRQPGQHPRAVPPVRSVRQRPVDDVQRRRPKRELHRVVRHDDSAGGEQGDQIRQHDGPKRRYRAEKPPGQQVQEEGDHQGAEDRPGADAQLRGPQQRREGADDDGGQGRVVIEPPVQVPRPLPVVRLVLDEFVARRIPKAEQGEEEQEQG